MLRLHYMPGRASMAPHAALAEARAEYTLVEVKEDDSGGRPAAYRDLNPWGQVPTLEDGDLVLTEASAIMLHLADRFPAAGLGAPVGTPSRSQLYRWLAYLATTVQQTHLRWFYPHRYTTDPDGAKAVGAAAGAELHRHLEWIDSQLGTRPWVLGDERSGADLYLFMLTRWGRSHDPVALEPPNLAAHHERMLERAAVQQMLAEEGIG